jgi:FKBP-type peptidyl-prolyl cis-trans isomerase SlyD
LKYTHIENKVLIMAIKNGDLVKLEYTAYAGESVIDTTDEKLAKDSNIYDQKKRYGPAVIKVGANQVLKGVDEALVDMEAGNEKEFEILPAKAFGERNPQMVKLVPMKQFREAGMRPVPGQVINIDDSPAVIRSVNSGRVVVDFNHPLAGATLKYKIKAISTASDLEGKTKLLSEKYSMKEPKVKVNGEEVELDLGNNEFSPERAREAAAVGVVANELKEMGAKKVSFKGEWTF